MKKLEVCWVAKRGMLFIIFSSLVQFSLSLFGSLCLCRMTRRSNFCWKKPLRHWSMSITYYPVTVSALMLFSVESIKFLTEVWIFIFILFYFSENTLPEYAYPLLLSSCNINRVCVVETVIVLWKNYLVLRLFVYWCYHLFVGWDYEGKA